jgi:hypothetical protein
MIARSNAAATNVGPDFGDSTGAASPRRGDGAADAGPAVVAGVSAIEGSLGGDASLISTSGP